MGWGFAAFEVRRFPESVGFQFVLPRFTYTINLITIV